MPRSPGPSPRRTRSRPLPRALAAAALLLAAAAPLRAQETAGPELEAALAEVRPGQSVRVWVRSGPAVEGGFGGVSGGALVVGEGAERTRIAAEDVRGVWVRGRSTGRGAKIGGIIGATGGLALGFLISIIPLEGESSSDGEIIATTTLLGAGSGAALGGIVGAAFPRWRQVYPRDRDVRLRAPRVVDRVGGGEGEEAAAPPARGRLGALEGAVGYGRVTGFARTGGGVGARVALMGQYRPLRGTVLALGPELEYHALGSTGTLRRITPRFDCTVPACPVVGQDTSFFRRQYAAAAARLVVRLEAGAGRIRPYALAGAGGHAWIYRQAREGEDFPDTSSDTYLHPGYTLGGGVRLREALGGRALGLDARRSGVFGADVDDQPGAYWTVSLTVGSN